MDDIIYMKSISLSLLSLLLTLLTLPSATAWCYKGFLTILGQVSKMDVSPDNAYLAITSAPTAAGINSVFVYDLLNYKLQFTYTAAGITCARFAGDGLYLGVSNNNGTIFLLSGKPAFSSTPIKTYLSGGDIVDIDFNTLSTKLLVCYSTNRYDVYSDFLGNLTSTNISLTSGVIRCRFSANDDIGLIDTGRYVRVYRAGTNINATNLLGGSSVFKQFDFKPSNTTPVKFIVTGNDTRSYYATDSNPPSLTANVFTLSGTAGTGSGVMNAACYSGDASYYAVVGGSSDAKVFLFYDNDTLSTIFNDVSPTQATTNPTVSCIFTHDGNNLYVGSKDNSNNIAYLHIYRKNCFQCVVGTYLSASGTCTPCTTLTSMAACAACTNATTCTNCIAGYYLNQTLRVCYKCDYTNLGCSTCVNNIYCLTCNLNYFLNTTKLCQSCTAVDGCVICTNNSACITCTPEYYLLSGVCTRCNVSRANCLRCLNSTICTQCITGFYLASGSCTPCNVNCISCYGSSTNCSGCVRGYYPLSFTCTSCSTYCMECDASNQCYDCQSSTFLTASNTCSLCTPPCDTCTTDATNCLNCLAGFYLSGASCLQCGGNCTTCVTSSNCTACSIGYYLTSGNVCLSCSSLLVGCASCNATQCFSCLVSYYLNGNFCQSCVTAGCIACNSTNFCQTCAIGHYLTASNTCLTCTANCQSCSVANNTCTSCIPGTYLSGSNCLSCVSNCQTCSGSGVCLSCIVGYSLNSGSCSLCTGIYGCTDCQNSTYCTACQIGKYLTTNNTCAECPPSCGSCSSASACLSCNTGFYASGASCLKCSNNCSQCTYSSSCTSCNAGYYLNGAICASCWGVSRGCLTCNSTVCFNCQIGYHLTSSNLCTNCQNSITNCISCLSNTTCQACSQGYYLVAANTTCSSCNSIIQGCQSCSNSTVCLTCAISYSLNANSCTACPSKCLSCNAAGCITCAFRYVYNISDCAICSSLIFHCETCNSTSNCLRCFEGFYLSGGRCLSCQSVLVGCSYCNSSAICTTCALGYYLNNSTCSLCSLMDGCRLCKSESVCTVCSTGYALSGNNCITCSTAKPNCVFCTNSSTCVQCAASYYLNGASCSTCSLATPYCISCSQSGACSMCEGGFYLNGPACAACAVQGCELCTALSPTQCINCFSGYYLAGNTCQACNISGCLDCSQATTCLSCLMGYYLSSSTCSLCSAAISGCIKCTSGLVCTECQTLFYLSGSICVPCSNALSGCAFCTNSSSCLSCNTGYYLNSSNLCSLCTALTGCVLCRSMSTCTYCNSGYYLTAGTCSSCSAITNCAQCASSSLCTACISGYALSNGNCTVIQASSGSGASSAEANSQVKNVKLKSYYVSSTSLKHIMVVAGMAYTRGNASITNSIKLSVNTKNSSISLTITGYEWGKPNQLILYTNNPLNLKVKALTVMKRLLVGQSVEIKMNSSAQVSQSLLSSILPNLLTDSDLSLGYSLQDPQFYNSYMNEAYNTYYYVFGMVVTCLLFCNFLLKALCTVVHSTNHGYILGHIFALKTVSISLYPTFGEYINYSYGYMTADLPWLNAWIGRELSDTSDYSPLGFRVFFESMGIFSMYALPLTVFLTSLGLAYLCFNEKSNKFKLQMKSQHMSRSGHNRFKSITQFMYNFFYFGLAFAGCASLQGSIFNPYNIISVNGVGYVMGIMIYMALCGECFNSVYNNWNLQRLRLFVKGTFLSLAHFNPLYILVVVLSFDICLIIIEVQLKSKFILNIKLWTVSQLLINFSLAMIYYLPDSLFAIYCSAAGIFIVVSLQLLMHYYEKKVELKNYPFFSKEEVLSSDKSSNEDANWKINLEDYTLQKQSSSNQLKEKDIEGETRYPFVVQHLSNQIITPVANFREHPLQGEKNNRRNRRFRESSKNRSTVLNSSWTSFDMKSSL